MVSPSLQLTCILFNNERKFRLALTNQIGSDNYDFSHWPANSRTLLAHVDGCREHFTGVEDSRNRIPVQGSVSRKSRHISGDIIHLVSSKRKRLEARNFAVILILISFITYEKTSFPEQAGRSFTNGFSGPKSFRDFRETGPRPEFLGHFSLLLTYAVLRNCDAHLH